MYWAARQPRTHVQEELLPWPACLTLSPAFIHSTNMYPASICAYSELKQRTRYWCCLSHTIICWRLDVSQIITEIYVYNHKLITAYSGNLVSNYQAHHCPLKTWWLSQAWTLIRLGKLVGRILLADRWVAPGKIRVLETVNVKEPVVGCAVPLAHSTHMPAPLMVCPTSHSCVVL